MAIELLNMDCMTYMRGLPDKAFDLAIVDPPYGIGDFNMESPCVKKIKKWHYTWNEQTPDIKYFLELERVSKERIIWGSNYYSYLNGNGGAIVWDKDVSHPNMSRCEIASYSRLKKVSYFRFDWSNTDKFNSERGTDIHPCQKPIQLYEWLLTNCAKKGDRILDTHLGSGSSAIAAHNLGFDFVGMELDKDYYEAAVARFNKHIAQGSLFGNETDFVTKTVHQEAMF